MLRRLSGGGAGRATDSQMHQPNNWAVIPRPPASREGQNTSNGLSFWADREDEVIQEAGHRASRESLPLFLR